MKAQCELEAPFSLHLSREPLSNSNLDTDEVLSLHCLLSSTECQNKFLESITGSPVDFSLVPSQHIQLARLASKTTCRLKEYLQKVHLSKLVQSTF